jgi:CheY-like chemotaxis protein
MRVAINLRAPEVLYVDDSTDDQLLAVEAVESTGRDNDLRVASSAIEVWTTLLNRLETGSPLPALLVVDLRMPQVDGHLLMDKLAEDPDLSMIPVVVLTTSADPIDIRTANANGAYRYHEKPHRFDDLVELWSGILDLAEG